MTTILGQVEAKLMRFSRACLHSSDAGGAKLGEGR